MTTLLVGSYDAHVLSDLLHAQKGGGFVEPQPTVEGEPPSFLLSDDLARDEDGAPSGYAAAALARLRGLKGTLKAQVDADAEALRLRLITPGSGQAMEYQESYAQAQLALTASGDVKAADYPLLEATIGFDIDPETGKAATDVLGVARSVKAAYEAYFGPAAAIKRARIAGKAAIDAGADEGAARGAFDAIVWPELG